MFYFLLNNNKNFGRTKHLLHFLLNNKCFYLVLNMNIKWIGLHIFTFAKKCINVNVLWWLNICYSNKYCFVTIIQNVFSGLNICYYYQKCFSMPKFLSLLFKKKKIQIQIQIQKCFFSELNICYRYQKGFFRAKHFLQLLQKFC